jgi:hypothetical protein
MALSEIVIRNAKPKDKPYQLPDKEGLYLEVKPNGSRLWRFRCRFRGQERRLSLGEYPYIPLREGRSMYGGPSSWLLSTRSQAFRVPASYCSRLCNKMSRISPG